MRRPTITAGLAVTTGAASALHAEVFDMAAKRTHIHDQTNPFIGPGELDRLTAAMAADFDKQLAPPPAPQGRQT